MWGTNLRIFFCTAISLLIPAQSQEQAVQKEQPEATPKIHSVTYRNTRCGFTFTLPPSWKGYRILHKVWRSDDCSYCNSKKIERGTTIVIRNPHSTASHPWVDILIIVLTIAQSQELEAGDISLSGAAPIGPSELGRNGRYVFYLPTRFGMYCDVCPGYDEVNNHILAGQPLHPLRITGFPPQPNLVYLNHNYGFSVTLPTSWKAYQVLQRSWCPTGTSPENEEDFHRCPIVALSHFTGSVQHPEEDIPIVIFTLIQWQSVQKGDIVLSDTPIALRELGRNTRFVFVLLPADYYSFAPDLQIVEGTLSSDAFRAF